MIKQVKFFIFFIIFVFFANAAEKSADNKASKKSYFEKKYINKFTIINNVKDLYFYLSRSKKISEDCIFYGDDLGNSEFRCNKKEELYLSRDAIYILQLIHNNRNKSILIKITKEYTLEINDKNLEELFSADFNEINN